MHRQARAKLVEYVRQHRQSDREQRERLDALLRRASDQAGQLLNAKALPDGPPPAARAGHVSAEIERRAHAEHASANARFQQPWWQNIEETNRAAPDVRTVLFPTASS